MRRLRLGLVLLVLACGGRSRGASAISQAGIAPQSLEPSPDLDVMARSLDSLNRLNPLDDARASVARGDLRLWAVEGYVLQLPGVPDSAFAGLKQRLGFRVMPWTGDMTMLVRRQTEAGWVVDSTHGMWQGAAYRYAQQYNREVLQSIQ